MTLSKYNYVGDGVYAIFDGDGVQLRANSHETPTDTIYLETWVFVALCKLFEQHNAEDGMMLMKLSDHLKESESEQ